MLDWGTGMQCKKLYGISLKYVPTTVLSSSLATLFTGLSSVDWLSCVCFDIDTSSDAGFQQAFSHRIEHDFNAHSSP
ncbi:hypothetical protein T12_4789 [Trichinella patagoniensis]|uniref:Uncharacterized protein n=1 Tax=Trichinella patagoniensis TaxID=990121 RepID=A0A0V0Z6R6_9BILA|nr:hypothetical protein T12_4789 [Trichinella patagoniensis]